MCNHARVFVVSFSGHQAWIPQQTDFDGLRSKAQIARHRHQTGTAQNVSIIYNLLPFELKQKRLYTPTWKMQRHTVPKAMPGRLKIAVENVVALKMGTFSGTLISGASK